MSRITLHEKLKRRADYAEIVKRVNKCPKPVKYVEDTFSVTYLTAKKFVDELNGITRPDTETIKADASALDKHKADIYLKKIDVQFNYDSAKPTFMTFSKVGDELEKFSVVTLTEIFKNLYGKEPTVIYEFALIKAIKYIIQEKYYSQVFKKDIPSNIKILTESIVGECLK